MISPEISFYPLTFHIPTFDLSFKLYILSVIIIPVLLFLLRNKLGALYFSISVLLLIIFYIIYNYIDWLGMYSIPGLALHLIYLILALIYLKYETYTQFQIVSAVYIILLVYIIFCGLGFVSLVIDVPSRSGGWPSDLEIMLFHPMLCFANLVYFLLLSVIQKKVKQIYWD